MKLYLILTAVVTLIMMVSPIIPMLYLKNNTPVTFTSSKTSEHNVTTTVKQNNTISVLQASSGKITDTEMFDYVCGALAYEMPLSFHPEALKAQAVACYTYALWIKKNADNAPNELSEITDSSDIHQGFLTEEQMREKWKDDFEENYQKLRQTVSSVYNQYISYEGEPILAMYHSISAGKTESAENVFGENLPYLQSVSAPGDKLSPKYMSTLTITSEEFKTKLKNIENMSFDFDSKPITILTKTDTGYVSQVNVYSQKTDSRQLRGLLDLKSTFFDVNIVDNNITLSVYGSGHGVGMSQYSADYMARQGYTYEEILMHFYKNTTLEKTD